MSKRETKKQLFWKLWKYIVIFIHIIFILSIVVNLMIGDALGYVIGLLLVISSWLLTWLFIFIEDKLQMKYDQKHTKQIKIENSFLGTCIFEQKPDESFIELKEYNKKIKFGKQTPTILYKGSEKLIHKSLEKLEKIYNDADNILEQIHKEALQYCEDWGELDANNNPVDFEFIKKYCNVSQIEIVSTEEEITISLISYVSNEDGELLLGYHDLVTEINCNTNEIDIRLEG